MSNLKPAPIALTPELVAKLVGDRPAYGKGLVRLPIEGKLGVSPTDQRGSDR